MTPVPPRETLNGALMRRHNGARVLDAVRRRGPVSRALLVRETRLSAPTVSALVDDLLVRKKLLRLAGVGESTGGRRPVLIEFNAEYGYVAGVDLGSTTIRLALADLNGRIVARHHAPTPRRSRQAVVDALVAAIRTLLGKRQTSTGKLLAIGVGAPGMTDVDRGVVISAVNLRGWVNVPLREILEREFDVPVAVDNDVNMAALGEYWAGSAREARTFVFIALGAGVGAGLVVDGRLHRGTRWYAGEISHMQLDYRRWNEDFGEAGYLESHVGAAAIAALGERTLGTRRPAAGERTLPVHLFEAARQGDPEAQRAVEQLAVYLGTAVANVVTVLDPSLVVFGGGISHAGALLVEPVRRVVSRIVPNVPDLRISALGDEAQLHGALYTVLQVAERGLYASC